MKSLLQGQSHITETLPAQSSDERRGHRSGEGRRQLPFPLERIKYSCAFSFIALTSSLLLLSFPTCFIFIVFFYFDPTHIPPSLPPSFFWTCLSVTFTYLLPLSPNFLLDCPGSLCLTHKHTPKYRLSEKHSYSHHCLTFSHFPFNVPPPFLPLLLYSTPSLPHFIHY